MLQRAEKRPVTDTVMTGDVATDGGVTLKRTTKKKGINFAGYAKLLHELRDTAREAIVGPRPAAAGPADTPTENKGFEVALAKLLSGRKKPSDPKGS
jgi:hypothetical protein